MPVRMMRIFKKGTILYLSYSKSFKLSSEHLCAFDFSHSELQRNTDYLFEQLPMLSSHEEPLTKVDLNNTHSIMDVLLHPEKKFLIPYM